MIILICSLCSGCLALSTERRICGCGKTFGQIFEGRYIVSPYALPLGISNESLRKARRLRRESGWGTNVDAMIMPREHFTIDHSGLLEAAQQEVLQHESDEETPSGDNGSSR